MATTQGITLHCILCWKPYTLADSYSLDYFVSSAVCRSCYEHKAPECFGKRFDPEAIECKRLCPDRVVCKDWVQIQMITEEQRNGYKTLMLNRVAEERREHRAVTKQIGRSRGPQPFAGGQAGSLISRFFERATSETGLPHDEIQNVCDLADAKPKYYIQKLHAGSKANWAWDIEIKHEGGRGSVLYIRNVRAMKIQQRKHSW